MDPLQEKYPNLSPYNFTANCPLKFIDPDGREVIVHDAMSYVSILNTLTAKEIKHIHLKSNGEIKIGLLGRLKHGSANFEALKTLAKSPRTYNYITANGFKTADGNRRLMNDDHGEPFRAGFFLAENTDDLSVKSPGDGSWVVLNADDKTVQPEERVEVTAHEGFGHGIIYDQQEQGFNVDYKHHYVTDIIMPDDERYPGDPEETGMPAFVTKDMNEALANQISKVEKAAVQNFKNNQADKSAQRIIHRKVEHFQKIFSEKNQNVREYTKTDKP